MRRLRVCSGIGQYEPGLCSVEARRVDTQDCRRSATGRALCDKKKRSTRKGSDAASPWRRAVAFDGQAPLSLLRLVPVCCGAARRDIAWDGKRPGDTQAVGARFIKAEVRG
ncbi:MAG TPA: hypothetical protein VF543_00845 [Pyrinomonadaceae bacterium]